MQRTLHARQQLSHFGVVVVLSQRNKIVDARQHAVLAHITLQPPHRLLTRITGPIVKGKGRFHEVEQITMPCITRHHIEPTA